jgi:hypothetical protein
MNGTGTARRLVAVVGIAATALVSGGVAASASTSAKVAPACDVLSPEDVADTFAWAAAEESVLEDSTTSCSYKEGPAVQGQVSGQVYLSVNEAKTKKQAKKAIKLEVDLAKQNEATPESVRVAGQKGTFVPSVDVGDGASSQESLVVVKGKVAIRLSGSFIEPDTARASLIALAETALKNL